MHPRRHGRGRRVSGTGFIDMGWLGPSADVNAEVRTAAATGTATFTELVRLANLRLDFAQTNRLDKTLQKVQVRICAEHGPRTLKLAVLSSSTVDHLLPGLRVAALRRNCRLQTFVGDYGQYRQALQDDHSPLFQFQPDVILFAFHAAHVLGPAHPAMDAETADGLVDRAVEDVRNVWRLARRRFRGQILQQTLLPVLQPLMGQNERRLPASGVNLIERVNLRLAELADADQIDLLALDRVLLRDGLDAWHDPVYWHRAKQEIAPPAAAAYGDMAARLIAAQQGWSAKCLVLDLDNTLWGGVIGDDGLEGIRLGQGSALGESYVEFQTFVRDLGRRGVILAVCSKNEPAQARLPFERHPDMVLKPDDIACFVANWGDKAANLRSIAEQLNIGIDSLVFVDDNPFERNLVRRELPVVRVPELPEDPAFYSRCIADAGYFEALRLAPEDFERGPQYRANLVREQARDSHTDLQGYLASLEMTLLWQPFDEVGLQRIVQLINKTNQFNLTTRRYTQSEVLAIMRQPGAMTLQLRLVDKFGDNGVIGVVIGGREGDAIVLDAWLMSCRVLGRQVELATLNVVAAEALRLGAARLVGTYLPTKKNGMVEDHYRKLGFSQVGGGNGASTWQLQLAPFEPSDTCITVKRVPS